MDDFFDSHERFYEEVLVPLKAGKDFSYRKYDCSVQKLGEPVHVKPHRINIIEGVYSHRFDGYDLKVFMEIDEDKQKNRLLKRCPEKFERFINEWIPAENKYFEEFGIKEKSNYVLEV
jgi:uridine kinase